MRIPMVTLADHADDERGRVIRVTVDYWSIVNGSVDSTDRRLGKQTNSVYRERLIIDRVNSSLEYVRKFEDNGTFSRKLCCLSLGGVL